MGEATYPWKTGYSVRAPFKTENELKYEWARKGLGVGADQVSDRQEDTANFKRRLKLQRI